MRIPIKGVIISNNDKWIYDWFEMDSTCPNDVSKALQNANGEVVELEINSGGGSVWAGSEIYTILKSYNGGVVSEIVGIAGSAASVIAMAGGKVKISPTGQIMIHNASSWASGNKEDMQQATNMLASTDEAIANAYLLKTGRSKEELLDLMSNETFMNAQKAIELGFADEVMFDDGNLLVASSNVSTLLPKEVIDKVKNELLKAKQLDITNSVTNLKPLGTKQSVSNEPVEEVEDLKTIEELKNAYPELYNAVKNEGFDEGVNAENTRIQEIEALSIPGSEDLVNKAKFETKTTAAQLAVDIVKAQKEQGSTFLNARNQEAQVLNNLESAAAPQNLETNKEKVDKEAEALANAVNQKRGIK